jgi:hypothetical protein
MVARAGGLLRRCPAPHVFAALAALLALLARPASAASRRPNLGDFCAPGRV